MSQAIQLGPNPSGMCMCGCGKRTPVARKTDVKKGLVKGLPVRFLKNHDKRVNLKGKHFGHLLAKKYAGSDEHGNAFWLCRCDCGNRKTIRATVLQQGKAESCGCARGGSGGGGRTTHGGTGTREYITWKTVRDRCSNPNRENYPRYGGAGVKVCARWQGKNGFVNFLKDLGKKPTPQHSLGRRMDMGDYSPSNAWWMTRKEQREEQRKKREFLKRKKAA